MAAHEAQADVVRHLSEALDRLASGILSHRIAEQFPGEYEALRENFNRAGESLRATMDEVRVSAMNIHGNHGPHTTNKNKQRLYGVETVGRGRWRDRFLQQA